MQIPIVQLSQPLRERRLRILLVAINEGPYEPHLLPSSERRRSGAPVDHEAKLLREERLLVIGTTHDQSSSARAQFPYASRLGAEVLGLMYTATPRGSTSLISSFAMSWHRRSWLVNRF